jgi:hypothetical protein
MFRRAVIALLGMVGLLALGAPAVAVASTPVAVVIDYGSGATVANMPISSSATVRLSLSAPPAGTTALTIDSAPGQEGALFAPTRHVLVFTPDTWNVPQQVRLISVSDHGAADLPVTGSDGEFAVIHAYANWGPLSGHGGADPAGLEPRAGAGRVDQPRLPGLRDRRVDLAGVRRVRPGAVLPLSDRGQSSQPRAAARMPASKRLRAPSRLISSDIIRPCADRCRAAGPRPRRCDPGPAAGAARVPGR